MGKKLSNTYIRDRKNKMRKGIEGFEEHIKRLGESRQKRENRYGTYHELIIKGQEDRLTGKEFILYEDESMKISYSYGYFEKGSRILEGSFANGIFNEEVQKNYGILDVINSVPDQYVNNLKKYPAYFDGRVYQLGKNAYDFILNNDISFEDYVNVMSIIQPEVTFPMFKHGYDSRELELKNIRYK